VRTLELRRHAKRDPSADRLSPEGRAQAEALGRTLEGPYDAVFASSAKRAIETAGLITGKRDPIVVDGLASETDPEPLANVLRDLFGELPEGARALAVGHTPLIETAVVGLTGRRIQSLSECEGVLVVEESGDYTVQELRL
jgi:phosphohistidine phosphatase SixA